MMVRRKHQAEAVVVGLDLNGLGTTRSLGKHNVPIVGISSLPRPITASTRYVHHLVDLEDNSDEELLRKLIDTAKASDQKLPLFLTGDNGVKIIAAHRDRLDPYYLINLPPDAEVRRLIDKPSFLTLARDSGFAVAPFQLAHNADELVAAVTEVGVPCVVKPQQKSPAFQQVFRAKAMFCETLDDALRMADAGYDFSTGILVQQWVPGGDDHVFFVLHYFDQSGSPLVSFEGRKIRQAPPLAGHTASAIPIKNDELVQISSAFFRNVNFTGLCSMEFKRDPRDGRFLMIEPTVGRTDWQSAVADINGVPIPYIAYRDMAGLPPLSFTCRRRPLVWVEFEGDFRSAMFYRRRKELTLCGWLRSVWPFRPSTASLIDPVPGLRFLANMCNRALRKCFRRHGGAKT
jgi:D-aspartate ligase